MEAQIDTSLAISPKIFDALLQNARCDTGNELDVVGFSCDYMNYHMSFYACMDEDHKVIAEDFGKKFRGDWLQMIPTSEQLHAMQKKIYEHVEEIEILNKEDYNSLKEANDMEATYRNLYITER